MASGILSGKDTGTGWRTDRAGIRIGKSHPARGKPLNVRRLVKRSFSVERRVSPTEIVCQDKNDIFG